VLALAEEGVPVFFSSEGLRGETGALVGAVAPGLTGGVAAGAVVVGLTCFEDEFAGGGSGDLGSGHRGKMAVGHGMGKEKFARNSGGGGRFSHTESGERPDGGH
jgi:hypothetical protein